MVGVMVVVGKWREFSGLENIEGSRIGEDPAGNVPLGPWGRGVKGAGEVRK